jgi:hypothetical protein
MTVKFPKSARSRLTIASGMAAGLVALFAGAAMAPRLPDGPVRMSGLFVSGLAGYEVHDSTGETVGKVIRVDADHDGRARYVHVALDEGGEATVASFRATLDAHAQVIAVKLADDLLEARAGARSAISPSA